MRITIGIPTRDRPFALARLLASLHAQTFTLWDLVIVDDSSREILNEEGYFMLEKIRQSGHKVEVYPGVRINQAYSHNAVLWSRDVNPFIMRVDDDMILAPNYLSELVAAYYRLLMHDDVGAVSGVIFTEHVSPRDQHPPIPTAEHGSVEVGVRGESLHAIPFMQEYSDDRAIRTEHLYSSYLYNRDHMRQVGGFPMVYSRGVSYHEETDASYRLALGGFKLFLIPSAHAVHSHEGIGGTRLMSASEHSARRESDWQTFQERLGLIRGRKGHFKPTVALYSQHCLGIGGGQRLTYTMLDALQDSPFFKCVHLYASPNEAIESPEFVYDNYGVSPVLHNDDVPDYYDVVISIGHTPPDPEDIPDRVAHIHYSLFPISDGEIPKYVDRCVAISEFSSEAVRRAYKLNCEPVYPFVDRVDVNPADIVKSKDIVIIGRLYGSKGIATLARSFLNMDLPDSKLHIISPDLDTDDVSYSVERLAEDERIVLHIGIKQWEASQIMLDSAVLWAGRGYMAQHLPPETAFEHFGYTPVEALAHYCVPVAFDVGGYRETTLLRWENTDQLERITKELLEDKGFWANRLEENRSYFERFSREQFINEWQRVILSTNGKAWMPEIQWRQPDPPEVQVVDYGIHIAGLSDHPAEATGYGLIAKELYKGFVDQGWHLHVYGMNGSYPDLDNNYASLWAAPRGTDSSKVMAEFLRHRRFDAFFVSYDPFIAERTISAIRRLPYRSPVVAYVSQEGQPCHSAWESILAQVDAPISFSKSAAQAVKERFGKDIDWAYLGVDHANFRRYSKDDRRAIRSVLGWDDRFIVLCVARNVRNKNLGLMMKTIKHIHEYFGDKDVTLLLHTNPVPDEKFHGINVEMYAKMLGLDGTQTGERSIIISHSDKPKPYDGEYNRLFAEGVPRSETDMKYWFEKLSMIDLYNLADLYLDMSSAEGFCLPIFEAMACGLPVVSVHDDFVRTELLGKAGMAMPLAADVWITGADLMMPMMEDVAYRIHSLRNPEQSEIRIDHLIKMPDEELISALKWDTTRARIVEAMRKCLS